MLRISGTEIVNRGLLSSASPFIFSPMKDGLYHKQLGLPPGVAALWAGDIGLQYGRHAQSEASLDRYGKLPLFPAVEFEAGDVVEIEVRQGEPVKAVLRVPLDDKKDLVYALSLPVRGEAFVRTVWFNDANDSHRTLDRSKYVKP